MTAVSRALTNSGSWIERTYHTQRLCGDACLLRLLSDSAADAAPMFLGPANLDKIAMHESSLISAA